MATEGEIEIACDVLNDLGDLNDALSILAAIESGSGDYGIVITRDGNAFALDRLIAALDADDAIQTTLIADLETAIAAALGPDEVTATTIRKAIKDAADSYDAVIAGT